MTKQTDIRQIPSTILREAKDGKHPSILPAFAEAELDRRKLPTPPNGRMHGLRINVLEMRRAHRKAGPNVGSFKFWLRNSLIRGSVPETATPALKDKYRRPRAA